MGSSFCTAKISSGQEDINEKIIRMPNHRSLQHSTKDIQRMSSKEVDLSHFCFTNSCGSCLGIGGFGLVREIEHLQTEKKFALKSMSKYMLLQRNCGVGAVFIELQILQNLKLIVPAMQVYICNLHYAFQDDKFVYMVLDFCSGGDMRFNLNNVAHGRFDEGTAKFYICQALLALNACHQISILHRDCKPENLVMCSNGYLKLTDFGVAKSLVNVDHCFATSGTHGYLPPEVYITPHLHGRLADWFAMGVTLHELLTGRRPFESYRLTSFRMPRYKDTLDVNHLQSRPYLSDGAKDFVSNCLQQNPSDRLGAMNDIREIMDHPWLRDVDWNGLYHQTSIPPLTPKKYSLGHEVHMEEVIRCVHEHNNSPSIPDNQQNKFQRFMYNNTPRFNKVGPLSHPVLSVTRRGSPISTLVSVDEESSCLDVSPSVQCD